MDEVTQFMIDRKDAIKVSFVESQAGMPAQSLKPGVKPIPEKYITKILEVLETYYGYRTKKLVTDGDNQKIGKDKNQKIGSSDNLYDEPLDFYCVPEGKVVYKGQDGVIKTRLGSGQWRRVGIPHLFIALRVLDPVSSNYKRDDILASVVAKLGTSEDVIELPEGMEDRGMVR